MVADEQMRRLAASHGEASDCICTATTVHSPPLKHQSCAKMPHVQRSLAGPLNIQDRRVLVSEVHGHWPSQPRAEPSRDVVNHRFETHGAEAGLYEASKWKKAAKTDNVATSLQIQRPGLETCQRTAQQRPFTIAGAFFAPALLCYGGCAWETLGSAGLRLPWFSSPRTAATHSPGNERVSSSPASGAIP
jgi:hypothetical protein